MSIHDCFCLYIYVNLAHVDPSFVPLICRRTLRFRHALLDGSVRYVVYLKCRGMNIFW